MSPSLTKILVAALSAACLAPAAVADVGGGGATLAARAYHGDNAAVDADGPRLSAPAAGSLFGFGLPGAGQSYCQVGSGSGLSVLTSTNGNTDDRRACPATFLDAFIDGASGFSAPAADTNFAGSDVPAGAADFTNYVAAEGAQHTQMTQFPSLFATVAVIYRNTQVATNANVYLTEAELCNIWSGRITNWNQLVRKSGAPFPSKPIKLVYRSDSSGTSFGFSNHLNWVCQDGGLDQDLDASAAPLPFAVGDNFSVNGTFASAFPVNTGIPAGATSASGNPGVISQVDALDGSIGYAEAANLIAIHSATVRVALIAATDTSSELDPAGGNVARHTGLYRNPKRNNAVFALPATYTDKNGATYAAMYTDRALPANDATYGRPVGLGAVLTAGQAPVRRCVFLVQTGAYATSGYKTAGLADSGYASYPIGVVTYLLGNHSGNGKLDQIRAVLGSPYNKGIRVAVTSVGVDTGYSYLTGLKAVPPSGGAPIVLSNERVNACTK